jgi:hypothetical protein
MDRWFKQFPVVDRLEVAVRTEAAGEMTVVTRTVRAAEGSKTLQFILPSIDAIE